MQDTALDRALRKHLEKMSIKYQDLEKALEDELEVIVSHMRRARSEMMNAIYEGTEVITNLSRTQKRLKLVPRAKVQSLALTGCYRRCLL